MDNGGGEVTGGGVYVVRGQSGGGAKGEVERTEGSLLYQGCCEYPTIQWSKVCLICLKNLTMSCE